MRGMAIPAVQCDVSNPRVGRRKQSACLIHAPQLDEACEGPTSGGPEELAERGRTHAEARGDLKLADILRQMLGDVALHLLQPLDHDAVNHLVRSIIGRGK